jgi:transcriptional regulator with XRE-family HTH domain
MIHRFGEKLKTLRRRHKMTQQELADQIETVQSYVSLLEHGEREPSAEVVLRVSLIFNISADQLLQDNLDV